VSGYQAIHILSCEWFDGSVGKELAHGLFIVKDRLKCSESMFRRSMALSTETPDAEFDVINGGFWTIPTLGLQELSCGFGTHRKWKLEDTPVTCSDASHFSATLRDIATVFSGRTMSRFQTRKAACSSGFAAAYAQEKVSTNVFFDSPSWGGLNIYCPRGLHLQSESKPAEKLQHRNYDLSDCPRKDKASRQDYTASI
jgi:hypothetical protein